jgi:hypothetical protein
MMKFLASLAPLFLALSAFATPSPLPGSCKSLFVDDLGILNLTYLPSQPISQFEIQLSGTTQPSECVNRIVMKAESI